MLSKDNIDQHSRDIIKGDVTKAMEEFFQGVVSVKTNKTYMSQGGNSKSISLVYTTSLHLASRLGAKGVKKS